MDSMDAFNRRFLALQTEAPLTLMDIPRSNTVDKCAAYCYNRDDTVSYYRVPVHHTLPLIILLKKKFKGEIEWTNMIQCKREMISAEINKIKIPTTVVDNFSDIEKQQLKMKMNEDQMKKEKT